MARPSTAKRKHRRRGRAASTTVSDPLSDLSEDLLLYIASRLQPRQAVALSVLARRFRHLPTLFARRDSVSLSLPDFPIPLCNNPPILLRRLVISPSADNHISTFRPVFNAAIAHGVSELVIRLPQRMPLPKSVLSIRSLAVLSLHNCAVMRPSVVAFPCLRTLKLTHVVIPQGILTAVLAAASRLDTLEMVFCTGFHGVCSVESPTVRNFVFRPVPQQRDTLLKLTGLVSVRLYTRPKIQSVQLAPAPGIRKAYLHIARPHPDLNFRIQPFLDAGTELVSLTLRDFAMMLLYTEYKDTLILPTTFQNLRKLSVSLDLSCRSETIFMVKLLESCPSLQHFTISAAESNDQPPCFADHRERLLKVSCLPDLVQLNFLGFRDEQYQKELFVFLLNRTNKLKKLAVRFLEDQESTVRWILSTKRRDHDEKRSKKYNQCQLDLVYTDS